MSELVRISEPLTRLELVSSQSADGRSTARLTCAVDAPLSGALLWAIAEEATLDGAPLPRPEGKPFYRWQLPELTPDHAIAIELLRDPATAMTSWWSAQLRAPDDDRILAATSMQSAPPPGPSGAPQPAAPDVGVPTLAPADVSLSDDEDSARTAAPARVVRRVPADLSPAKPLEHRPAILAGDDSRQISVARELALGQLARAANAVTARSLSYPCLLPHLILVHALLPNTIGAPEPASTYLANLADALDAFLDDVVAATLPEAEPQVPWQIPPRRLVDMQLTAHLVNVLDTCATTPSALAHESRAGVVAGAVQLAGMRVLLEGQPAVGDGLHAILWLIPVRVTGDAELTGALAAYRDALAGHLSSLRGCDALRCLNMLMARRLSGADRAADVLAHVAAARATRS